MATSTDDSSAVADGITKEVEAPPPKAEPEPARARSIDRTATLLGFGFWLVVIGALVAYNVIPTTADLILEVAPGDQLVIKGTVLRHGVPVKSGSVQLVLDEPKSKLHLGSMVLDVNEGRFSTLSRHEFRERHGDRQLRISANFWGTVTEKEKVKSITADAVLYTNSAPPVSARTFFTISVVGGLLGLLLIVLFTGDLTVRKARFLFGVTYLWTFLSVTLPIITIVVVAQSRYLVDMMKESPIGLVKARSKGVSAVQWLVNIGGVVVERPRAVIEVAAARLAGGTGAAAEDRADGGAAATAGAATTGAGEPPPTGRPGGDPTLAASTTGNPPKAPAPPASPVSELLGSEAFVDGGLAIPFYVILLAVFGAGINMMRQVPSIQRRYGRSLPKSDVSALRAITALPVAFSTSAATNRTEEDATHRVQKAVIKQYMYLLSAPFLAIAVYYLLQILATNVSEPVLVLMAFATGLISDRIVDAIIRFARKTLGESKEKEEEEEEETKAEPPATPPAGPPAASGPPAVPPVPPPGPGNVVPLQPPQPSV
jgi:hypothetical protein